MAQRTLARVIVDPNVYSLPTRRHELDLAAERRKIDGQLNAMSTHPVFYRFDVIFRWSPCSNTNNAVPQLIRDVAKLPPQIRVSRQRLVKVYCNEHSGRTNQCTRVGLRALMKWKINRADRVIVDVLLNTQASSHFPSSFRFITRETESLRGSKLPRDARQARTI